MPLLISPIDGSPMRQIHRYGIEIDVCPSSGGIWLDKGELEKLMALLKEDTINDQVAHPYKGMKGSPLHRHKDDDDDYDDDRYERGYKRKGKMSRIIDIFDF